MSEPSSSPVSSPTASAVASPGSWQPSEALGQTAALLSARINDWLGALGGRSDAHSPADPSAPAAEEALDGFAPVGGEFRLTLEEIMEDLEYGRG